MRLIEIRIRKAALSFTAVVILLTFVLAGCKGDPAEVSSGPRGVTAGEAPTLEADPPAFSPGDAVTGIDNPYLPWKRGARWVYQGQTEDGLERIEVRVLDETRAVMGVQATVVRDTVSIDGELVEDTRDWYVQDKDGNVWYLGEEVENYADGLVVDNEGSWEAGVDGALPGIVMWAKPGLSEPYRQELYPGEAEDMAQVIDTGLVLATKVGRREGVLVTREWTPLEPGVSEQKYYAPGVGLIREEVVEGGSGTIDLVEFAVPK